MPPLLSSSLTAWLDTHADGLDTGSDQSADLLPRLAADGLPGIGVPAALGGSGGGVTDAIEAVAALSERSLAAGLVFWGHLSYLGYLAQSPNAGLRDRQLPDLLAGRIAGATGLSNVMKFLSGIEELQVSAAPAGGGRLALDGRLPWVTNLRPQGFRAAAAVKREPDGAILVVALSHEDSGLARSLDLDLMGLRGTNTAALTLTKVNIGEDRIIHPDAKAWLPAARPGFLGLQCGLSIGLARRALAEAGAHLGTGGHVLADSVSALGAALHDREKSLRDGLRDGLFAARPAALFEIRIGLAAIVAEAIDLELQATGGQAYLAAPGAGLARRRREAAFIPIITPSLVQLKTALAAM